MDKTQGSIITHAPNDNEPLISGLNLKFEVSFLTEKHKCTLFVCLSFTVCMLFPSQQKDMCGERAISEQHNGKPIQTRELENKDTATCHCLVSNHPWVFTLCKELPPKRTKEHGNVMTDTKRESN